MSHLPNSRLVKEQAEKNKANEFIYEINVITRINFEQQIKIRKLYMENNKEELRKIADINPKRNLLLDVYAKYSMLLDLAKEIIWQDKKGWKMPKNVSGNVWRDKVEDARISYKYAKDIGRI